MNYNTYPTNTMLPDSFDRFHVEKLDYLPAGSYQPMPVRPYTFSPTDSALGQIVDRMERFKSGSVTTGILSGLTEGILAPSAVGFDSAVNAQWVATPRYAFFLKVRSFDAVGLEECHYIFGFTDQEGVSPINGVTNPEMSFTINNVITTGAYTIQTPMGLQRQEKLLSHFNTIHSTQGENLYTQRPLDIFQTLSLQQTSNYLGGGVVPQPTQGMVGPYTNNTVSSASENSIATQYLSKILTNGMHVNKMNEVHMNSYNIESDDRVSRYFAEQSIMDNKFVRMLNRVAGFLEPRPIFLFRDLMRVDPRVDDISRVLQDNDHYRNPLAKNTPDVGEHWHGQDVDTLKAHSVLEASVAMATKYGFTKLSFSATNKVVTSAEPSVNILNFNSFLDVDDQTYYVLCDNFKQRFVDEIFLNETDMGRRPIFLEIHVDLLRSSKIYIEYYSNYGKWYTLPTFANSTFTSILTNDNNMVLDAATNLDHVIAHITPKSKFDMGGFNTFHPGM